MEFHEANFMKFENLMKSHEFNFAPVITQAMEFKNFSHEIACIEFCCCDYHD